MEKPTQRYTIQTFWTQNWHGLRSLVHILAFFIFVHGDWQRLDSRVQSCMWKLSGCEFSITKKGPQQPPTSLDCANHVVESRPKVEEQQAAQYTVSNRPFLKLQTKSCSSHIMAETVAPIVHDSLLLASVVCVLFYLRPRRLQVLEKIYLVCTLSSRQLLKPWKINP